MLQYKVYIYFKYEVVMTNKLSDAFNSLNSLNNKTVKKKEDKPIQTLGEAIEKSNSRVRFQRNRDPDREVIEPSFSHLNKNFSVYKNPVATQRIVPTPEQEVIVNSDARRLKIVAFAGAGKTSTLIQYANKRSRGKGLYIAFNKDIKTEAMSKLPSNVKCMTSHGLAYSQFGLPLKHKLNMPINWKMVYEATGIESFGPDKILKPYARLLLNTVSNFIASADQSIESEHIPYGDYKLLLSNENFNRYLPEKSWIVVHAEKLWQAMITPENNNIGATHDCYLKLMQLSEPELPYDYILLDEAQDSNPAILDVVSKHKGIQVLVGDPHQSIYSFRKSIDAMTNAQSDATFSLTGSFRFGPEIADFANTLLAMKGEEQTIVGLGESGLVYNGNTMMGQGKCAYISRSNAGLFKEMLNCVSVNKSIYISGGLEGMRLDLFEDLYNMKYTDIKPRDSLLSTFKSFEEFKSVASDNQEVEWISRCKIIDEMGESCLTKLTAIKNNMVSDISKADQSFSTAHRAKGLQFDHVTLADDFVKAPATLNEYNRFATPEEYEEVNILYVAATRAVKSLNIRKSHELYWKMISPMLSTDLNTEERNKRNMLFKGELQAHFEKIALNRSLSVFYAEQKLEEENNNNIDADPFREESFEIKKPRRRL